MGWIVVVSTLLTITACGARLDSAPATNTEVLDKLERAVRIKGLLQQLDNLPDSDLRELLLQLRSLRRSRTTPPPRDLTRVPIGQLTEEEIMQIANLVPKLEKHKKKPHVPLDIPHDLTRVPMSKFIEAFRIVHPEADLKKLETKMKGKDEAGFGEEERQGGAGGQKEDPDNKDPAKKSNEVKKATNQTISKDTEHKLTAYTVQPGLDDLDLDADP